MAAKKVSKKKELEEEQVKLKKIEDLADQEEFEYVAIPPDGGFGWVIAFAAMVFSVFFCYYNNVHFFLFSYVTLYVMVLYLLLVQ
jgi:hypothetical protein